MATIPLQEMKTVMEITQFDLTARFKRMAIAYPVAIAIGLSALVVQNVTGLQIFAFEEPIEALRDHQPQDGPAPAQEIRVPASRPSEQGDYDAQVLSKLLIERREQIAKVASLTAEVNALKLRVTQLSASLSEQAERQLVEVKTSLGAAQQRDQKNAVMASAFSLQGIPGLTMVYGSPFSSPVSPFSPLFIGSGAIYAAERPVVGGECSVPITGLAYPGWVCSGEAHASSRSADSDVSGSVFDARAKRKSTIQ